MNNELNDNELEQSTEEQKYCTNCGNVLNSSGECSTCKKNKRERIKHNVRLTISIILLCIFIANLFLVVPCMVFFSGFMAVVDLFISPINGHASELDSIYLFVFGYCGASIYGLIGFIISTVQKGKLIILGLIMTLLGFLMGILIPYSIVTFFGTTEEDHYDVIEIEKDAIIYQDNNYTIKQKSLKKSIRVTVSVEHLNNSTREICFERYASINKLILSEDYKNSNNCFSSGEHTFIYDFTDYTDFSFDKINSVKLFFTYEGGNKMIPAEFKLNGKEVDIEKELTHSDYSIAMENEDIRVYYKPNTKDYIYLFVEGKGIDTQNISIVKIEVDLEVTTPTSMVYPLYDNTTRLFKIKYDPCRQNMTQLEVRYSIYDGQGNMLTTESLENIFE